MKLFEEVTKEKDRKKVKQLVRDINFLIDENKRLHKAQHLEQLRLLAQIKEMKRHRDKLIKEFGERWEEEL